MLLAVEKLYDLPAGSCGLLVCDNLGGLNKSCKHGKKFFQVQNMPTYYTACAGGMHLSKAHCNTNMFMGIRISTRHGSK